MKTKWVKTVVVLLAISLAGSVWAADIAWTGAAGTGLWLTPGNWTPAGPPPTAPTVTGNINMGYVAAYPIATIGPTDVVDCGSLTVRPADFHGPNWGSGININGGSFTHQGFVMAPVADAAAPSIINVSNGGQMSVINLLLGDNWWFWTSPYVIMNVYDTSFVKVNDWLWLGGKLNLYGGTVDITGNFNMDTHAIGVGHLEIEEGTLIIRGGDISANVAAWITAGQLTAYGTIPGTRGAGSINVDTTTIAGGTIITASPSSAARDPNPTPLNVDGSIGTLISGTEVQATLNWKAGLDSNTAGGNPFDPNILTHYVFLGTSEAGMALVATIPQSSPTDPQNSFMPDPLSENTVYYWTVEEGMDDGTGNAYPSGDPNNVLGPIWSFNTIGATPEIETDPVSTTANPNASFIVTASSVAGAYQWFKVATPTDITLTDTGAYSGTQTATLTVTNATLAEEGQYYCIAYNGITPSGPSASAWLWTKRLMGHWKFDGNMSDSVALTVSGASTHDGAIVGTDPNYATGLNGNAMQFFNDGDYVAISDADFFNFYPMGFTMSYWYKENSYVGWRLPASKLDPAAAGWLFGVDSDIRNQIVCFFESDNDPSLWADGNAGIDMGDGNWHMITATYDPADNTLTMFTDGDENESVVVDLAGNPPAAAALSIGGRAGENSIDGLIDDVKIYSYPLTALGIAQLYVAFEPTQWVCVEDPGNPLNAYDINGDCRVTLADFALFAAQWLECQRYPASACN